MLSSKYEVEEFGFIQCGMANGPAKIARSGNNLLPLVALRYISRAGLNRLIARSFWFTWLALALGAPAAVAQRSTARDTIKHFAVAATEGVKADGGGCAMVAVFKGNQVVWAAGFGLADVDQGIVATAETIGRTGSISKSFTAVLVCQLAEQGVLNLDDPVETHLPEIKTLSQVPEGARPITYRMLASHTAGLAREPNNVRTTASGPIELWEQKILEAIPSTVYKTKPLTEYSYSNIGFGILGLAGSRAAGKPFMSLVETRIFKLLSMDSSTFVVKTPEMKKRLAVGYVRDRATRQLSSELPTREHAGRGYKVPNGGIYSTVGDLARFAAALMGETDVEILSAEMRNELFSPQLGAKIYGLGFRIVALTDDIHAVGHGGSVAGYRADLRFDLKSKWGVATLRTTRFNPPVAKLFMDLVQSELQ